MVVWIRVLPLDPEPQLSGLKFVNISQPALLFLASSAKKVESTSRAIYWVQRYVHKGIDALYEKSV